MKYKIGDVVRLKSAEELIKLGCENRASSCAGGKEVLIVGFYNDKYVMKFLENENFLCFKEIYIEKIINKANLLETYTFDELKKRVDALKDYATKLSSELNIGLSIEVETEVENVCVGVNYRSTKGSSRINIID